MVSYFVPRGRFLMKAGNLRQSHHKHAATSANASSSGVSSSSSSVQQQQQQLRGKWPMLRQLRQSFCTGSGNNNNKSTTPNQNCVRRNKSSFSELPKQPPASPPRSVWTRWTGFLLRWAPMGIAVFGVLEWQLHKQKCQREQLPRTASEFQSRVYCSLPLRLMSRAWGWIAACRVPTTLRPYVYGWYSNAFGVNLEEALHPDYKHYASLAEFFTRPLRDGVRTIDAMAPLVSPADGRVLHFGSASNSLIEQVKGVNYSIESFLGPPTWRKTPQEQQHDKQITASETATADDYEKRIKQRNDGTTALYQCVIYLAPGDYHRFHSPAEWQPEVRRHFDGELLSVSPTVATWLPGLFCLNERALYLGKWAHGFFSYTAVGATNVGSVQIYMDEELRTNRWVGLNVGAHKKRRNNGDEFDELPLAAKTSLGKGDLVGQFNMGSTIVLLFEAPRDFEFSIEAGQKIRVGEPLGYIVEK